jgi:predicted RNase H-related nuclease YkuK (DUF458 family)
MNSGIIEPAMDKKDQFFNPSLGYMSSKKMVSEIARFVDEEPSLYYRVVIGTDSQAKRLNGVAEIDFVTAVVVHRKGRGGRYFWQKEKIIKKPILRDKIYTETLMSLACAEKLVPMLRASIRPAKYDLEIHIDVGALGPTRELIREVVGMVQGNGYVARTKPESWGASSVADKHT